MTDFSKSKLGDPVYSITAGWGKITDIGIDTIIVKFSERTEYEYYFDGKCNKLDTRPELYLETMIIMPQQNVTNENLTK